MVHGLAFLFFFMYFPIHKSKPRERFSAEKIIKSRMVVNLLNVKYVALAKPFISPEIHKKKLARIDADDCLDV